MPATPAPMITTSVPERGSPAFPFCWVAAIAGVAAIAPAAARNDRRVSLDIVGSVPTSRSGDCPILIAPANRGDKRARGGLDATRGPTMLDAAVKAIAQMFSPP